MKKSKLVQATGSGRDQLNGDGNKVGTVADRRLRKLLDAACQCFLLHGFAGAKLEDIAEAGGAVKQTIYNHFSDKTQLFNESIAHLVKRFESNLDPSWYKLSEFEFLKKMGALQLRKLKNRELTGFLQLAVKESRHFPALPNLYAECVIKPDIDFVANYFVERGIEVERAVLISWCFRAALTGFGTLKNLANQGVGGIIFEQNYLDTVSREFVHLFAMEHSQTGAAAVATEQAEAQSNSLERTLDDHISSCPIFSEAVGQSNRGAILRAALVTFMKFGFDDATMDEVATVAKVSKQTVYSYFKSKNQLYKSLCAEILEVFGQLRNSPEIGGEGLTSKRQQIELFLRLAGNAHFCDCFRLIISESYAFPVEANTALQYLYGFEPDISVLPEDNATIYRNSLALAGQAIIATYVLLRRLFMVGSEPQIAIESLQEFAGSLISD